MPRRYSVTVADGMKAALKTLLACLITRIDPTGNKELINQGNYYES
jgi:hypothetical protein